MGGSVGFFVPATLWHSRDPHEPAREPSLGAALINKAVATLDAIIEKMVADGFDRETATKVAGKLKQAADQILSDPPAAGQTWDSAKEDLRDALDKRKTDITQRVLSDVTGGVARILKEAGEKWGPGLGCFAAPVVNWAMTLEEKLRAALILSGVDAQIASTTANDAAHAFDDAMTSEQDPDAFAKKIDAIKAGLAAVVDKHSPPDDEKKTVVKWAVALGAAWGFGKAVAPLAGQLAVGITATTFAPFGLKDVLVPSNPDGA